MTLSNTNEINAFLGSPEENEINAFLDMPQKPVPPRTTGDVVKDLAVAGAQGIVDAGAATIGLADIPTAGLAGKVLHDYLGYDPQVTNEFISQFYSEPQKAANKAVERADGFVDKAKAFIENPSTIVTGVAKTVPTMLGGAAMARKALAAGLVKSPLIAGAIGEGAITSGSFAEDIRQKNEGELTTPKQTAAIVGAGAVTSVIGIIGARIAKKMRFRDIDTMLASGKMNVTEQGIAKRIIGGGFTEGVLQEMPQAYQEHVWMNAALDKPLTEGASSAAAEGLVLGTAMGAGANIVSRRPTAPNTIKEQTETPTPDEEINTFLDSGTEQQDAPPVDPVELKKYQTRVTNLSDRYERTGKPEVKQKLDEATAKIDELTGKGIPGKEAPTLPDTEEVSVDTYQRRVKTLTDRYNKSAKTEDLESLIAAQTKLDELLVEERRAGKETAPVQKGRVPESAEIPQKEPATLDAPKKKAWQISKAARGRGEKTLGTLSAEVEEFKGSGGIASENSELGFKPAFRHGETGEIFEAKDELGRPSGVHLLDGIPDKYVTERDEKHGDVIAVSGDIESGFLKQGKFYTRKEAAQVSKKPSPQKPKKAEAPKGKEAWEDFVDEALEYRAKEIKKLQQRVVAARKKGQEEIAQIYEGQIKDYQGIDEQLFRDDVKANLDYYGKSNIDPFLRFKNKEMNRAKRPKPKTGKQKLKAAAKKKPRRMLESGRADDGKVLKPGDIFLTNTGRETTPFPKQKMEKYHSQWTIDNAVAEAKSRGADFQAKLFGETRIQKGGVLVQGDSDSMIMYMFGDEVIMPAPKMTRPLVAPKETKEAKTVETDQARVQEIKNSIAEGEMILKSGKTTTGRKMSKGELQAVQKSVDNAKAKIGEQKMKVAEKVGETKKAKGQIAQVAISDLSIDPSRFQYKRYMGKGGASSKLRDLKQYNPELGGIISVWKDPADGKTYVVNGHHRYDLAKRTGYDELTIRYLDADSAANAKFKGALINIAEGQGSPEDAAVVFRKAGLTAAELEEIHGVSVKGVVAKQGMALSMLDEWIFDKVEKGELHRAWGVIIGEKLSDHTAQKEIVKLLERESKKRKTISTGLIEQLINDISGIETKTETQASLFGDVIKSRPLLMERAELRDYAVRTLSKDKRLFGVVGDTVKGKRLQDTGNVLDIERNKEISKTAGDAAAVIDRLSSYKGPISDVLNKYAKELADAKKSERNAVKRRFLKEVRGAVQVEVAGRTKEVSGRTQRYDKRGKPDTGNVAERQVVLFGPPPGQLDIFGGEPKQPKKKITRKKKEPRVRREAQVDLFTGKAKPIQKGLFKPFPKKAPALTKAPPSNRAGNLSRGTIMHTTGVIRGASAVAKSAGEVASLLASIRKSSQEHLFAVTTDKSGNILEIHRYSKGGKSDSSAHPIEIAGHVLNIPNAHTVYVVHNHPSGDSLPSEQDLFAMAMLSKIVNLKGIGIEEIIIAGNEYQVFDGGRYAKEMAAAAGLSDVNFGALRKAMQKQKDLKPEKYVRGDRTKLTPISRTKKLPVKERGLHPKRKLGEPITNPDDFNKIIKSEYGGQDGFLFLDAKLQVVGFLPFPSGMSIKEAATKLIQTAENANATGFVLNVKDPLGSKPGRIGFVSAIAQNLHGDLNVFDIIEGGNSYAGSGRLNLIKGGTTPFSNLYSGLALYSVKPGNPLTGLTRDHLNKIFHWADSIRPLKDGSILVTKGPNQIKVKRVDHIDINEASFELAYRRKPLASTKAAGAFIDDTILLSDIADIGTVGHELWHFAKAAGILTKMDIAAIRNRIGKTATEEQEAAWIEEQILNRQKGGDKLSARLERVLQKIMDFIDSLVNLVHRTSRGVIRDLESGKLFTEKGTAPATGSLAPAYQKLADQWYSQMEQSLEKKLPGRGTPEQLSQMVQGWAKKGEFKAEELEWSGLNDWLAEQTGKVTKTEVMAYLAENRLGVQEVVKADVTVKPEDQVDVFGSRTTDEWRKYLADNNYLPETEVADASYGEIRDIVYDEIEIGNITAANAEPVGHTKFSQYQEPGGENYKELLITLPERGPKLPETTGDYAQMLFNKSFDELREDQVDKVVAQMRVDDNSLKRKNRYKGPHYEEPNILSHVRFNERTDADGNRVLFLEEIQSDQAQDYRKQLKNIEKVVANDFKSVVRSMVKAGVLKEDC